MIYQAGTGFSFTDDDLGYAQNETDIAKDLFKLVNFYIVNKFPFLSYFIFIR